MYTEQQLTDLLARQLMGWERLDVGYFGTDSETARQRELELWMDKNGLHAVGAYWIDVDRDFWISVEAWRPVTEIETTEEIWYAMALRGFWCRMQTPFEPGGSYWAGFTPHSTTGWNGRPDYWTGGVSLSFVVCAAAAACLTDSPTTDPTRHRVETVENK